MVRLFTLLLAAGSLVAWPAMAQSGSFIYWSSIATACVPDNASIQENRYQSTNDKQVQLRPSTVDPVVLICGVSPNPNAEPPNAISITYLDSTGSADTAAVEASLIRVNRNNGNRSLVVSVSSDEFLQTTLQKEIAFFDAALNFESFYYYVRIDIDRSAANQTVRAIGVAIELLPV